MSTPKWEIPCFCGESNRSCAFYQLDRPHLHCFKCGDQKYDLTEEEIIEMELGLNLSQNNLIAMPAKPVVFERGIITTLEDRGISKETAEKYRVEKLFNGDVAYGYALNHFNTEGEIVAQKIKKMNKQGMHWNGDHSEVSLFGQQLFPAGGKYITITEGEEDAMACYQMLKAASPGFEPVVLSIPDGALSAEKSCKKSWEYINSFDNIILAFDGDDVGKKAAEKIVRLFNHKPKVILFPSVKDKDGVWSWKDSNDYLKGGKSKEFVNMWWRAERMTPQGVRSFKSLWGPMTTEDKEECVQWPWEGLNKKTGGWRTGEFVIIKAPPKVGKTSLLREVAYHIRTQSKFNVGLIFLEDTNKTIGLGMCALHMNKPIQFGNIPYTMDELKVAHDFLSEEDRFTLFDPEDNRTAENIFNKIMYFVKAHDCKFIILDHISMLAYQNPENDERRFLDKLCADLKAMTTAQDIGIAAVIHVNDDGKTRGSRAPVQLCNLLINLIRDKLNIDPVVANTTEVVVEENRKTGDSGVACHLYFNRETGRLEELDLPVEKERGALKFDD